MSKLQRAREVDKIMGKGNEAPNKVDTQQSCTFPTETRHKQRVDGC